MLNLNEQDDYPPMTSHEMQLISWQLLSLMVTMKGHHFGGNKESKCMVTLKHFPHERCTKFGIGNIMTSDHTFLQTCHLFQKDLRIICFEKTRLTDEGTVQILGVGLQLGVGGLELGFMKSDMVYLT